MKQFDPKKYVIYFNNVKVEGYADGTFINVARSTETFTKSVGADGQVTRVRSNDRSGMATVTLQAESPTNKRFSDLIALDEEFGTGWGVFMMKDLNGETVAISKAAWITKPADIEVGTDAGSREWSIELERLDVVVGGGLF